MRKPGLGTAAIIACAWLAGCGGDAPRSAVVVLPISGPAPTFDCGPGGASQPSELLVRPVGGIPNHYVVAVRDSVEDVPAMARALGDRYSGTVTYVWTVGLRGFAMVVEDAKAPSLAGESGICFVEQEQGVSAASL